jgi:hypothetical protein
LDIGPVSIFIRIKWIRMNTLPELDQQFIKQSMGYRGPTVFGENTIWSYTKILLVLMLDLHLVTTQKKLEMSTVV